MRATNDNIVVIQTMYKGVIQISPGIIYPPIDADGTQTSYPGVVISINKKSQSATITVDEFLYIKRIVEHFDFIHMGHQLLSEYLLLKKETVVERIGEGRKITLYHRRKQFHRNHSYNRRRNRRWIIWNNINERMKYNGRYL